MSVRDVGVRPPAVVRPARPATTRAPETSQRRTTLRVLTLACAATALVRAMYASVPLRSDESGYLLLARRWAAGTGEFVYGDYHVDRPPLLMAIYRVAAMWETDAAIRVISIPVAVAGVLALARAGHLLGGAAGARWAAVVAAALLNTPAVGAESAAGGFFATVLVAGALAATLEAWGASRTTSAVTHGLVAGALATSAVLVKQNFLDGLVFVAVLLALHVRRDRHLAGRAGLVGGAVAAGAASVVALTVMWALSAGVELTRMWHEVVQFRAQALETIAYASLQAPATRAATMLLLAIISVLVPICWLWARWLHASPAEAQPAHWALTAVLLHAGLSIAAGGSYWTHYLLQLAPPVALVAGVLAARADRWGRGMRRLSTCAAASAAASVAVMVTVYAAVPHAWYPERLGEWLRASSHDGDTAFVAYGSPSLLESADMTSPYPYLWSLSMRTYDPDQERLRSTLRGDQAPTWLVRLNDWNSWAVDRSGRLRDLVETRYRYLGEVCGEDVYLRADVERRLAPEPDC